MRLFVASALAIAAISNSALANECPSLIHQAQEELKAMGGMHSPMMKEAEAYIAKAQAEHDAGKHEDPVADAKKALELLKM
jgi:hypothetical protein